jgi:hypothetical protein
VDVLRSAALYRAGGDRLGGEQLRLKQTDCSFCPKQAVISVFVIALSVGRIPRKRKNTPSIKLCKSCFDSWARRSQGALGNAIKDLAEVGMTSRSTQEESKG